MRQRFENSGTFLNEATRLLTLLVALHSASQGDTGSIIDRPRDIPTMPNRRPANDVTLHLEASSGP